MLKKLVCNLCSRNDGPHWKTGLCVEENVAHQERFPSILLSDNDDHGTFATVDVASFFDHSNVELPQLEIHLVASGRKYCMLSDEGVVRNPVLIDEPNKQWEKTSVQLQSQ